MARPRFNTSKTHLKHLVKQLHVALDKGLNEIDVQVQMLKRRIKELISSLQGQLKGRELRRILGAMAVVLGIIVANPSYGQSFAPGVSNPFGLSASNDVIIPTFGDLDGDGDMDLLTGEYGDTNAASLGGLYYYENTGSATSAQFPSKVRNPFNLNTDSLNSEVLLPELADIDGDGDLDIITGGSGFYGTAVIENTGTALSPSFGIPVIGGLGLSDTTYLASPTVLDIDDDGDLDVLTGSYYGSFSFFENVGTGTAPIFVSPQINPFGLQASSGFSFITSGDVDWDGDMDLIVGEYYGDILYYENTGTKANAQFAASVSNPSNIQNVSGYFSFPALADLDGDSDVDLMVSEYYGDTAIPKSVFTYYENTATGIGISEFESGLEIYPNTVKDIVRIRTEEELIELWITDMSGKTILVINPGQRDLDLSNLAPGAYNLHLVNQHSTQHVEKLIKL